MISVSGSIGWLFGVGRGFQRQRIATQEAEKPIFNEVGRESFLSQKERLSLISLGTLFFAHSRSPISPLGSRLDSDSHFHAMVLDVLGVAARIHPG